LYPVPPATRRLIRVVNFFPFFGGAILQPLRGLILDTYGKNDAGRYPIEVYRTVMLVLLLTPPAAPVCTFLMKETHRKIISFKRRLLGKAFADCTGEEARKLTRKKLR
jgi:hypothetical protein